MLVQNYIIFSILSPQIYDRINRKKQIQQYFILVGAVRDILGQILPKLQNLAQI